MEREHHNPSQQIADISEIKHLDNQNDTTMMTQVIPENTTNLVFNNHQAADHKPQLGMSGTLGLGSSGIMPNQSNN